MRVFVLCTGRCGSTTFIKSCSHIWNFSSGHESLAHEIGWNRLDYPDQHIEADNRLAWRLGQLEERFGDSPLYVHLYRDRIETAKSFVNRFGPKTIMSAWTDGIVLNFGKPHDPLEAGLDYVDAVNSNIRSFLKDKNHIDFPMEQANEWFMHFWKRIGATGDYSKAYQEWAVRHNASSTGS